MEVIFLDYDRIILEMLNRISVLEEKVKKLESVPTDEIFEEDGEMTPSVGKKYRFLADYLLKSGKERVTLTFREIESILQTKLPPSAYGHRAFWANSPSHSIALSWMNVGYKTIDVTMGQSVVFEKKRHY